MQRYIGDILDAVRRDTHNVDWAQGGAGRKGTIQEDLVRYANWAQQRAQGVVARKHNYYFEVAPKEISIVADQDTYTVPDNVYLGSRIQKVEYSRSGLARDYNRLRPFNPHSDYPRIGSHPCFYRRRGSSITLTPTPAQSQGSIRVHYERALDLLALRAGQVQGRTLTSTQLTALSIDTTSDGDDVIPLSTAQYICINDQYGNVKMYNIPITSYDDSTGIVTLDAFTFAEGESVAVGDYVTVGKYTTTHSDLVDDFERYISEYVSERLLHKDSSVDAFEVSQMFQNMEEEIVSSLSLPDKDIARLEEVDYDPMLWGDIGGYVE